ncbi:MAG: hypothetical protein K8S62_14060 [Candidatus Sabulitectum sp.]|nr:hypothetical protein [Candidatus Sabulitectum sp.]
MGTLKQKIADFFRPTDLPAKTRIFMEGEGLLFAAERVRITIVYHRLRAPGRSFHNKRETVWGSLAISNKRLVGYAFKKKIIHLPFDHRKTGSVKFSCVNGKVLVAAFDPVVFNPKQSGSMEIRYHFNGAEEAYGIIRDLIP